MTAKNFLIFITLWSVILVTIVGFTVMVVKIGYQDCLNNQQAGIELNCSHISKYARK